MYRSACQKSSKYSKQVKSYSHFHKLITDGRHSVRLFIKKSGIWQLHWLILVKLYLHAKIIKIFRAVKAIFTNNLGRVQTCLGKAIYKEIWHLTILLVRSCQYVSACQNYQSIPNALKVLAIFTNWLRTEGRAWWLYRTRPIRLYCGSYNYMFVFI